MLIGCLLLSLHVRHLLEVLEGYLPVAVAGARLPVAEIMVWGRVVLEKKLVSCFVGFQGYDS
jgi:hypothetical protein